MELDGSPAAGEPFAAWMHDRRRPCAVMLVDRPDAVAEARGWIEAAHAGTTEALAA